MRIVMRGVTVLLIVLLFSGSGVHRVSTARLNLAPMIFEPSAADEVFNEDGGSAPTVSFSLVQGGLSDGSVDGGANVDAEPKLVDVLGADSALGTIDGDLSPSAASAAVDAGNASALPTDRFDLDGDGNVNEPLPIDRAGNLRSYDAGIGSAIPDMGAYEYGAQVQTNTEESSPAPADYYLGEPYPNPTAGALKVGFRVRAAGSVRVMVYDALGREVSVVYDGRAQAGHDYQLQIPTSGLANGLYFVRLKTNAVELSRQFILTR